MKLHTGLDVQALTGTRYRQSATRGIIGALVVVVVVVGGVILLSRLPAPTFVWVLCAVVAAVVVPLFVLDALAKLRSTNWLLRRSHEGLWINLSSYRQRPTGESPDVLHLRYDDIAHAHKHIDTWTTPSRPEGGSTHWKQESLDLHLAHGDTRQLAAVLTQARNASKNASPSVTAPTAGVVRIAWRGPGHDVVLSLEQVLGELRSWTTVAEPTRTDRPDWRKLSDAELGELVEQLVRWGDSLAASDLLIRRGGLSAPRRTNAS